MSREDSLARSPSCWSPTRSWRSEPPDSSSPGTSRSLCTTRFSKPSASLTTLWGLGLPAVREPDKKQRMVVYRRPRRLIFRKEVLEAYDERCAICDFDLRINDELLGLEAAHIQWHSHNGPDNVFNGLALCLLHHRALDRGAVGLEAKGAGYRVLIASQVRGRKPSESLLSDFSGQLIRPPRSRLHVPHRTYVDWHRAQVFRN